MRPDTTVVVLPGFDQPMRLRQQGEHMLIQAFVPQATIEAFHARIWIGAGSTEAMPLRRAPSVHALAVRIELHVSRRFEPPVPDVPPI